MHWYRALQKLSELPSFPKRVTKRPFEKMAVVNGFSALCSVAARFMHRLPVSMMGSFFPLRLRLLMIPDTILTMVLLQRGYRSSMHSLVTMSKRHW